MRIPFSGWVAPFGDPGINDRSHLPRAFRSVPRPSSPLSAKASTRCPYFALEHRTQRQKPPSDTANPPTTAERPPSLSAHSTNAPAGSTGAEQTPDLQQENREN